jgi:hypothetical protein
MEAGAHKMDIRMQAWIQQVRQDHIVGRGSCSVIDECYTDSELEELITQSGVRGAQQVRFLVRRVHREWREREREIRATAF